MSTQFEKGVLSTIEHSNDSSREHSLPPYHLFEKLGHYFAYDLTSHRFLAVDEPAYCLLSACLTMPLSEAKDRILLTERFSPEVIEGVVREVELLAGHGLFDAPDLHMSGVEVSCALRRRYADAWTKLELALAETCNLACTYCYCETSRDMPRKGFMSEGVARKAIDWLFRVSGDARELSLTLFGGEPLLNKAVFEFVMEYSDTLAKRHGKEIHYVMTTNATLLDDMVIDYIKKHNFGLMVSLDGPPHVHDRQCPFPDGRGSFDLAAAGIKRLMRRRKSVTVRCTLTKLSPQTVDLVRFFEDFGFRRIVLGQASNPVNPSPVDCDEDTLDSLERQEEEQVLPWIFDEFAKGQKPKYFPYEGVIESQASPTPRERGYFRCGACRGTTTVGADGAFYPCHRFVGMSGFVFGSVDAGPDLARAERFWRDYNESLRAKCGQCWACSVCASSCPWFLATPDGGFRRPEERECLRGRRFVERAAYVHYRLQTEYPKVYDTIVKGLQDPKRKDADISPDALQESARDGETKDTLVQ